jgi:hypothetical protein
MAVSESTLRVAARYVSIAVVTCAIATGGMWLWKRPSVQKDGPSTLLSPAHWMFWVTGRDIEQELRNPTPVFEPGEPVVPAFSSEQIGDFARYMKEEQEKRDQMIEEIRAKWGPHD